MDVKLDSDEGNVNEIEQNIVAQISDLLRNASLSESNHIWEQVLQLKLIGARQAHSVSLYFQCNQTHEVDHLEELATKGYLKKLIESLFSHLTEISNKIKLSIKWTSDVFNDCRLALQGNIFNQILSVSINILFIALYLLKYNFYSQCHNQNQTLGRVNVIQ